MDDGSNIVDKLTSDDNDNDKNLRRRFGFDKFILSMKRSYHKLHIFIQYLSACGKLWMIRYLRR